MLHIAYFIIVSGQNIKMPLNHPHTAILTLLRGPWLKLDGPGGHYVGPHRLSSAHIVTK